MKTKVEEIIDALDAVIDPCSVGTGASLTIREMGLVQNVRISEEGAVSITLRLSSPGCLMGGYYFQPRIINEVSKIEGVSSVDLSFGDPLTWTDADITEEGRRKLASARMRRAHKREHQASSSGVALNGET